MKWSAVLLSALLLPGVALAGPEKGKGRGRMGEGTGGSGSCEQFRTMSQDLETQARSLAVTEGCTDVSQCKSAAVGARACGGPRDYLIYCSASTDEDSLLKKLEQLRRTDEQSNQQCGTYSICIFMEEPQLELVNGVCQQAAPESGTLP
jgi:hypothetical protein